MGGKLSPPSPKISSILNTCPLLCFPGPPGTRCDVARQPGNVSKSAIAQTLWIGNAAAGGILAMLGGLLACETFGYRMYLVVLGEPIQAFYAGAVGAALGTVIVIGAIWRS